MDLELKLKMLRQKIIENLSNFNNFVSTGLNYFVFIVFFLSYKSTILYGIYSFQKYMKIFYILTKFEISS